MLKHVDTILDRRKGRERALQLYAEKSQQQQY